MAFPMSFVIIIQLVLFSVLLASGQVLFKIVAQTTTSIARPADLIYVIANPWAWGAVTLYGLATLLWIVLLQQIPLSRAYPFAALGFVLVPAASALLFREVLGGQYLIGTACILIGIIVIGRAA